jgi:hypothetical protein
MRKIRFVMQQFDTYFERYWLLLLGSLFNSDLKHTNTIEVRRNICCRLRLAA